MLYFNRIDVSERIDVNKTSASRECDICHYWYFLNKGFKFQPNLCNECHDLSMMSMKLSGTVILNIKVYDCCYVICGIGKKEAVSFMQNINLTKKKRYIIKQKNLLSHIKMGKEI